MVVSTDDEADAAARLAEAEVKLAKLRELDADRREALAEIERTTAGMRQMAAFRAANIAAVMGYYAVPLAEDLVAALRGEAGRG